MLAAQIILGKSKPVLQLMKLIERIADSKANVLIIGESGTGKELVARAIHELSAEKDKAFIAVNCGAIPETLFESALFGHKRGSFTGAVNDQPGFFEAANGGTLFLDEIGEVPLSMQVKLLRSLQERVIKRVGANEEIRVNVRILAATNKDLEVLTKQGTFREDLYYRLNVIQVRTPPLRERGADIEMLANVFMKRFCERQNKEISGFSNEALAVLSAYSWPGNIRELENVVERAVTLETGNQVQAESLPVAVTSGVIKANLSESLIAPKFPDFNLGPVSIDAWLDGAEKHILREALIHSKGDRPRAAALLQVAQKSFQKRLEKHGLK